MYGNCTLPDTSHCNFTFNQQHLYWRLFTPLDVETAIFVEPNFIQKVLSDFDQNAPRYIRDNVEPY
jgi:hypothetical protein